MLMSVTRARTCAFVLALLGRIGIFLAEQPEIEPVDVLLHGAQSVQRLMEEVRFVRVVDRLARHVRLAERYVESELRCASAGDLLEYRPGSLFRAKSRGKALIQRRGLGIERRATKDGAIVFAYHEIPHRLEEPAVSPGSRTKDLRLGHRHKIGRANV